MSRVESPSRAAILAGLRAGGSEVTELPTITGSWLESPDAAARCQRFEQMLEAAGGQCRAVADMAGLETALAAIPEWAEAGRRLSLVPGVGAANVDMAELTGPHDLADIDFALLPGVFGVAENGAVWIDGEALPQRSVLVLPEHLGIALRAGALVDHMHGAYERLSFDRPGFGCFVSGPSKTADIEQALVIGAHGARSLHVFLVGAG